MEIVTKNLTIKSNSIDDLKKMRSKVNPLYDELILKIQENPKQVSFYTIWDIYKDNKKIGFLRFKGAPDKYGVTEIYFEIVEELRNNGYATEALKALLEYSFKDPRLHSLIGIVKNDNPSAARVLAKNKFKYREESEEGNIFEKLKD